MNLSSVDRAHSIVGYSNERAENDFYPTPDHVTMDIMRLEKFCGDIWEPACGDGAMSKVLSIKGNPVYSSDLIDRGYGSAPVNFLTTYRKVNNIITNPPFILAEKFVYHALQNASNKVAMFLKLSFLEGAARKIMFEQTPLARVYVYSKRVSLRRNGEGKQGSGMIAFAWFVWEQWFEGEPVIRWI
jgi:hypothetical protein